MKIDLEFVQASAPIFLAGVNIGEKLYPDSKGGMVLWYDTEEKMVFAYFKGKVAPIQHTTTMTMADPKQWGLDVVALEKKLQAQIQARTLKSSHPMHADHTILPVQAQVSGPGIGLQVQTHSAQVSTPMDTIQKAQVKGVKKFAKFQGEESQGE